ncbi:MAG: GDP-mannose 4,6-dehydratase [Chloroflexota bacterium]|nr:SDR family oxidoreductase [Chloroflexota bacterium]NOG63786.1 SDR family oxidoreductase [Chloroflexota bacterium]GIK64980.1 MAG: GDP-mannose 4,6-dehydratase [Chloroflexota bacterium]
MTVSLVTGGAGFIGSHLVEALLAEGHEVRVVDNFATGKRENLSPSIDKIKLYEISITDAAALQEAMDGVNYVFHQAAIPSVPRSVADPVTCHEVNVTGTFNVLNAARLAGVKRVVYAASSSAYGDIEGDYKQEDMAPRPLSPYGAAKLAGEYYMQVFYRVYGLETVCLRYFNVFGPRQDPKSEYAAVIPKFATAMLEGKSPTIYGDGTQSRDFTYIENTVKGNLLAAKSPIAPGQVINLACGQRYTLLDLVNVINDHLGTNIKPTFAPTRTGDIKHSLADISKAEELLGYAPARLFKDGVSNTVNWFAAQPKKEQS